MSIFFVKWGSGRYTMSVVTPTFIIEPYFLASCRGPFCITDFGRLFFSIFCQRFTRTRLLPTTMERLSVR